MKAGGYAGNILRVDLTEQTVAHSPTMDYAGRFLGGRGLAAGIYWDEVRPEITSFDAGNLVFSLPALSAGYRPYRAQGGRSAARPR